MTPGRMQGRSSLVGWAIFMTILVGRMAGVVSTGFCKQVVEPLGHGCTEYTVETDDGFILLLHRLNLQAAAPVPDSATAQSIAATMLLSLDSQTPAKAQNSSFNTLGDAEHSHPVYITRNASGSSSSVPPAEPPGANVAQGRCIAKQILTPRHVYDIGASAPAPLIGSAAISKDSSELRSGEPTIAPGVATVEDPSQIPLGSRNPGAGKGAPVLLMHLEFLNGDSWFQYVDNQHTGRLLPLMLLQDGFDVWVGHQRATYWGHSHATLNYTETAFWNWTWDQHAAYDLPAQLCLISGLTNQRVHYVGVSQSATVGAAGATDPITESLMQSLTLIAPTTNRGNTNSALLDAWAYYFGNALDTEYYATGFQNGAFNYSSEFPPGPISGGASGMAIDLISGPNCCLGSTIIEYTNVWDGTTSFKNLLHWQQGIRTNHWAMYDYGEEAMNREAYGGPFSPYYNPMLIPASLPVMVIYGGQDWISPAAGINIFISQMQRPPVRLLLPNYAHYDFTYGDRREVWVGFGFGKREKIGALAGEGTPSALYLPPYAVTTIWTNHNRSACMASSMGNHVLTWSPDTRNHRWAYGSPEDVSTSSF